MHTRARQKSINLLSYTLSTACNGFKNETSKKKGNYPSFTCGTRMLFPDLRAGAFPGAPSWYFVGARVGGSIVSGSVEGEVLPIRPDSKDLRDFARLRAAFSRGSDLNHEPLTESRHHHW